MSERKAIALVIDCLYNAYERELWPGVVEAARDGNADLFLLPGEYPYAPNEEECRKNVIYRFLANPRIQGIVMVSTTLSKYQSAESVYAYVRRFTAVPVVSLGVEFGDTWNFTVSNRGGMKKAVDHLIEVHEIKKICFLRGPASNAEAEIRFAAYKESLADHGIRFDEKLTAIGNFVRDDGLRAMREILARSSDFGAVAAANDDMALAAMEALAEKGIKVPEKVAVVGFDNVPCGAFSSIPLTTVEQPTARMAYEATRTLLDVLDGKKPERRNEVETRVVIRHSCGCMSQAISSIASVGARRARPKDGEWRELLLRETTEALPRAPSARKTIDRFFDVFVGVLTGDQDDPFLGDEAVKAFNDIVKSDYETGSDLAPWNAFLTSLSNAMGNYGVTAQPVSSFLQKGRLIVGDAMEKRQAVGRQRIVDEMTGLRHALQSLITTFDSEQLLARIADNLPRLAIPSFYLSLYDKPVILRPGAPFAPPDQARIGCAYDDGDLLRGDTAARCSSMELVPGRVRPRESRATFIVNPLNFGNEYFGTLVTEMGPLNDLLYETLRVQISAALKASGILASNQRADESLRTRDSRIQELVVPMIETIGRVNAIAKERLAAIGDLIGQTDENGKKIAAANESVALVGETMDKMRQTTLLVDDIAVQINILSINASIEAARAGVHGKGFAVIANEVRTLARSTAENVEAVSETVKGIGAAVERSVAVSEESLATFALIRDSVAVVSRAFDEIAGRMGELSAGGEEIMRVIERGSENTGSPSVAGGGRTV
jgi:DNA-binding LacI/PurR family transcriptional regulator